MDGKAGRGIWEIITHVTRIATLHRCPGMPGDFDLVGSGTRKTPAR